MIPEQIWLIPI